MGLLTIITAAATWLELLAPGFDSVAHNHVEYRKILDKFSAAQTRLSVSECAIAYYGFALQPGFKAGAFPSPADEADMQRAIMESDYETAYALGSAILERAPVNLTALYWTLFAATETHRPWEIRNSLRGRYNSITHIISLSGDGTSTANAFRTVWDSDMYTYTMIELGLEIGDGYLWDERWTEFEVSPGGPGVRFRGSSIYFEKWNGK